MLVKRMDVMFYPEDGSHWKSIPVQQPSWDQVEQAVRRLDKHSYPFIWFSINRDLDDCEVPDFEVMGGEGDYWIAGSLDGYFQRTLFNPDGVEEEIKVWTSDQGFSTSEDRICHDLDTVLRAIRYFCEVGTFHPELKWEEQERS